MNQILLSFYETRLRKVGIFLRQLSNFPKPLQSLYNARYLEMYYTDLLSVCEAVTISVTEMLVAVQIVVYVYRAG